MKISLRLAVSSLRTYSIKCIALLVLGLASASSYAVLPVCGPGSNLTADRWALVALPCLPTDSTVQGVFGDDLNPAEFDLRWITYERDEIADSYIKHGLASPLQQGAGYWIYSRDSLPWDVDGTATPTIPVTTNPNCPGTACFEIPLTPPTTAGTTRVNAIGHPFPNPIPWADVVVETPADALRPGPAEAANLITNTFWKWNGNAYEAFNDATPGLAGTLNAYDGFWIKVRDGAIPHAGAIKLLIPEAPVNDPPVAQNDAVTIDEDTILNGDVLIDNGNGADSDPEGSPLNISEVNGVLNAGAQIVLGSGALLQVNTVGTFNYDPNGQFEALASGASANDSFTYRANDGFQSGNQAIVTVTVAGIDDAPGAVDDSATVLEDATATAIDVLNNDTDVDGGPISVNSVIQPANGTVTITNAGADLTYQPNPDDCNNGTPTDDFTYTLTPGASTATGRVTVTCVNDVPSFVKGVDQTVNEDAGAQSVAAWATAISPGPANEAGQAVSFNITANNNPGLFSAGPVVASNGTLTYTPALNANGMANITIEAMDNGGTADGGINTSAPQFFKINVTAVNDPPEITSDGGGTTASVNAAENQTAVTDVQSSDPEGDSEGSGLTYSLTGGADQRLFTIDPDAGVLTFSIEPDFEKPVDGDSNGVYEVQVTVTDSGALTDIQDISVTVTDINDPPLLAAGALKFIEAQFDGVGGVDGLDSASSVTVSPDGGHLYAASAADNAVAVFSRNTSTGALAFVEMQKDGVGGVDGLDYAYSVTVSPDGGHLYAAGANDDAVAVFSRNTSTGALTFVEMQKDGVGSVDGLNSALSVTVSPDGGHLYAVGALDDAVAVFSRQDATALFIVGGSAVDLLSGIDFTVRDVDDANLESATVTITNLLDNPDEILAVNTGGTSIVANYTAATGILALTGTDTLANYQAVLRSLTYDNTALPPDFTTRLVEVVTNDGDVDSNTFTGMVVFDNRPPAITSDGGSDTAALNVDSGTTAVTDVESTDPDGESEGAGLTYSLTTTINGVDNGFFTLVAGTGLLTFTSAPDVSIPQDADTNNAYEVEVTVTDSRDLTDVQNITVTVVVPNAPPSITSPATASAAENQTAAIDVQATDDNDAEGAGLTFSITGGEDAALFSINAGNGVVKFISAPDFENPSDGDGDNSYNLQVTVTDSGGLADVQNIIVSVTDVVEVVANNDTYSGIIGNVGLNVPAASGVLFNDSAATTVTRVNGSGANVGAATTTTHGSVTVQTNGSFEYEPNAGNLTADSFTYEANGADTATVNLTFGSGRIWFVDSADSGANQGTLSDPFKTLAVFNAATTSVGDCVFVETGSGYSGPLTLLNNQIVVGQGSTVALTDATLCNITLPSHSAALPSVNGTNPVISSAANGINLASGNTLRGLDVSTTANTALVGNNFGNLTITEMSVSNTGGTAINLTNGNPSVSFTSVSAGNSGAPTGASGIALTNTTGSFTVTGDGSTATQGGNDSGGVVQNTTVDGIVLTSAADVTIHNMTIGDTAASPANAPDGTNNILGDGIQATGVTGLTLNNVTIARTAGHGVNAVSVGGAASITNLTVEDSLILNAGDGQEEHGLNLDELRGDNFVRDSLFDAFNETAIEVVNTSGAVDLTVDDTTFQDNQTTVGNAGEEAILIEATGTASIVVLVTGDPNTGLTKSIFDDIESQAVQANSLGTGSNIQLTVENSRFLEHDVGDAIIIMNPDNAGSGNVTVKDNFFTDDTFGAFALLAKNDSSGTLDVTVQDNTATNVQLLSLNHDSLGSGGAANGTSNIKVENNSITVGSNNIAVDVIATETPVTGSAPDVSLTVTNNISSQPDGNFTFTPGLRIAAQDATRLNANITGNAFQGDPTFAGGSGIEVTESDTSVVGLQGFAGGNPAAAQAFIDAANPASTAASFVTSHNNNIGAGTATLPSVTDRPSP